MTKARILADFISDGSSLADGTISVAEVSGAAPLASPTFTGTVAATSLDISGDIDVDGTTNLDVVDIDGAVDMASTLAVGGVVTANAGVVVDNITIDGTTLALSSGDLTLDVAGDIILNADGGDWKFQDGATGILEIQNDGTGNAVLITTTSDKDIRFLGNDGGSTITALTLDMSEAGAATFNGTLASKSHVITGTDNNSFEVKTEHAGNPSAVRVAGAGSINGISGTFQNFTVLNVMQDTGSLTSIYAAGNIKSDGNIVIGTAGKGIDFSATAGTGTSELLDDYEEGTWAPTFAGSGATGVFGYSTQNGYYEKIGKLCHVHGYLVCNSVTSNYTGVLRIAGLPFTNQNTTNNYSTVHIGYSASWATAAPQAGHTEPSTTYAVLKYYGTNGNAGDITAGLVVSDAIIFSITYRTA